MAAAAQVAAVSGDVRRALELCRKAAEIAEEQQHSSTAGASSTGDAASAAIAHNLPVYSSHRKSCFSTSL